MDPRGLSTFTLTIVEGIPLSTLPEQAHQERPDVQGLLLELRWCVVEIRLGNANLRFHRAFQDWPAEAACRGTTGNPRGHRHGALAGTVKLWPEWGLGL